MTAVGALVGALLGLLAVPAVHRLPLGIPERLEQPAWTRRAGSPPVLALAGAAGGALVGGSALGLVLVAVLVPAVAIDLRWRVVPDSLIVVGALAALVLTGAAAAHLIAAAVGGVVALALALAARGGFGLGDVKLIALAGLVLGAALPLALAVAFGLAGVAALPLLAWRGRGATLPLVPFLAVGMLTAAAYGGMGGFPL